MKKVIKLLLFLLIFIGTTNSLKAQESFKERSNLVLFSGWEAEQKNTNVNSKYGGLYVDWLPYKGRHWMVGPYLLLGLSGSENNLDRYSGTGYELGLGGILGYYDPSFFTGYTLFSSLNLGLKYQSNKGESRMKHGVYKGNQTDWILVSNLDIQFRKRFHNAIFPKTQIELGLIEPISSAKEATWNGLPIDSQIWPKNQGELSIKQTIIGLVLSDNIWWSPKVTAGYQRAQGENSFMFGLEVSAFKIFKDDFIFINGSYQINEHSNKNNLMWKLVFNISQL